MAESSRLTPWWLSKPILFKAGNHIFQSFIEKIKKNKIIISELPIGIFTQFYTKNALDKLKLNNRVENYSENNSENSLHFEVIMTLEQIVAAERDGFNEFFGLKSTICLQNMVLFDRYGCRYILKLERTHFKRMPTNINSSTVSSPCNK